MTLRPLIPSAALLLIAACGQAGPTAGDGSAAGVVVTEATCRPTPKGRLMTGCYLTLTARADDRLTAVSSPLARRVEIHESRIESGMMMMRPLRDGLALPAGQATALEPGGNHLMLMGLEAPLAAGQTIPLTLTFASASPVEVVATVVHPPVDGSADHDSH